MELAYSSTCADIMIYNFDKIVETGDLRYVVKDWNEREEIEFDTEVAMANWEDIYDEFCRLADDNTTIMYYRAVQELSGLKATKYVVQHLAEMAATATSDLARMACFIELKNWGFHTDPSHSVDVRLNQVENLLRFFDNKIQLKENEIDGLKGDGEKTPLMQQVVRMETALGRNLIDPKQTTVEKWQYMIIELKNKARGGK